MARGQNGKGRNGNVPAESTTSLAIRTRRHGKQRENAGCIDSPVYWAWVPDRSIYQDIMDEILDGVSAEVKLRIAAIIKVCKSKKLTDDGKQQKRRIMEKLFVHREITLVHVYICTCLCCPC